MEKSQFNYTRYDMLNPILKILKREDRQLSVKEIDQFLIEEMDITEFESDILHVDKSGRNRTELNYLSAWAKTYLKKIGYINNSRTGYWEITDMGKEIKGDISSSEVQKSIYSKNKKESFRLKKLIVKEKEGDIINVFFSGDEIKELDFYTLIIGQNTSGKSFLLGQLTNIFVYLEKFQKFISANRLKYEYYEIEYVVNKDAYIAILDFNNLKKDSSTKFFLNDVEIPFEKLVLPKKLIALSYNLNDRFNFSFKDTSMYFYQGIQKIKTKEFENMIAEALLRIFKSKKDKLLQKLLDILGYRLPIRIDFIYEPKKPSDNFNMESINQNRPDSTIIDGKQSVEVYNRLEECIKISRKISVYASTSDAKWKNISDFSSGEKQLLFTYINIVSEIKERSLVLIDEPENSLHPAWQIKYLVFLKELLNPINSNSHFILATHSPFLVSNLSEKNSSIVVSSEENQYRNYKLLDYTPYAWSTENILYQVFEVETVKNMFVDTDMETIINYFSKIEKLKVEMDELEASFTRLLSINNLSKSDHLINFINKACEILKERELEIFQKLERNFEI